MTVDEFIDDMSYASSTESKAVTGGAANIELNTLYCLRSQYKKKPPTHHLAAMCRSIMNSKDFAKECSNDGVKCTIGGCEDTYGHEIQCCNAILFIVFNRMLAPRDVMCLSGDDQVQQCMWQADTILVLSKESQFGALLCGKSAFSPKKSAQTTATNLLALASICVITPTSEIYSYFHNYATESILYVSNLCGDERMVHPDGYLHQHAIKTMKNYTAVHLSSREAVDLVKFGFRECHSYEDKTIMIRTEVKTRIINESPANESPANESPANESPANESPANESPANSLSLSVFGDAFSDAFGDASITGLSGLSLSPQSPQMSPHSKYITPTKQIRGKNSRKHAPPKKRLRSDTIDSFDSFQEFKKQRAGVKVPSLSSFASRQNLSFHFASKKKVTTEVYELIREIDVILKGCVVEDVELMSISNKFNSFLVTKMHDEMKLKFILLLLNSETGDDNKYAMLLSLCTYAFEECDSEILDKTVVEMTSQDLLDVICKYISQLFQIVKSKNDLIFQNALFYIIKSISNLDVDMLSNVTTEIALAIVIFKSKICKEFDTQGDLFKFAQALKPELYASELFAQFCVDL